MPTKSYEQTYSEKDYGKDGPVPHNVNNSHVFTEFAKTALSEHNAVEEGEE